MSSRTPASTCASRRWWAWRRSSPARRGRCCASAVFAFETTLQPLGLLPLLGGCTAAFLVSALLMRNTIMTEKIARRGVRVPGEYEADFLDRMWCAKCAAMASSRSDPVKRFRTCATGSHRAPKDRAIRVSLY